MKAALVPTPFMEFPMGERKDEDDVAPANVKTSVDVTSRIALLFVSTRERKGGGEG